MRLACRAVGERYCDRAQARSEARRIFIRCQPPAALLALATSLQ